MTLMDKLRDKMKALLKDDYLSEASDKYHRYFIRIPSSRNRDIASLLSDELDGRLVGISATDEGTSGFDVVYHFDFTHQERSLNIVIKMRIPRDKPEIPSVADIVWAVNWAERELMDLMGIKFPGHPDPRRLFLPYAWPDEEVA